jgi:hypothetical protein
VSRCIKSRKRTDLSRIDHHTPPRERSE